MELTSSARMKIFKGDSFSVIARQIRYYKEMGDGRAGCREGGENKIYKAPEIGETKDEKGLSTIIGFI